MKLSIKGSMLLALCAAVILAASYGLYKELTGYIQKSDEDAIGILVLKKKTAVRKYSNYVIWEDISNNTPVFNYDSIRTYPESAAYIRLNDGAEISLDENTMIVLVTDENGVKINFDQGAISAKSGTSGGSLRLNTRDTSVSMNKGELSVKKDSKTMDVNVFSGDAVVSAGSGDQKIDSNTAVRITEGKTELNKVSIVTVNPANNSRFISSSESSDINFTWNSDVNVKYKVEISEDYGFKKIIHSKSVSEKNYTCSLGRGDYYWRIAALKKYSVPKKFTIMHDTPHRYLYPVKDEKVTVTFNDPVNFRWSKSESDAVYEVEIFSDPEMKSAVFKNQLTINSLSLNKIPRGKLWWRVNRIYPAGLIYLDSPGKPVPFSLDIKEIKRMKPVPLYSGRVYATILSENIPLNWEAAKGCSGYIVEISRDKEFKNIISLLNTNTTFLRVNILPEGEYYWRIKAVYGKDDYEISAVAPLTVGMPEPVEYISPVKNDVLENISGGVKFVWKSSSEAAAYLVEVASDPDFKKIIASGNTQAREYTIARPGNGRFYWRVSITDRSGKVTVMGLTASFSIPSALDKPKIIFPQNLANINLDDVNVIKFQWSPVKGADSYQIEVFQRTAGVDKSLISLNTTGTILELRNFKSLEQGTLVWVVRARKQSGTRITAVSESDRMYFVLKVNDNISAPKIQVQDRYYVR